MRCPCRCHTTLRISRLSIYGPALCEIRQVSGCRTQWNDTGRDDFEAVARCQGARIQERTLTVLHFTFGVTDPCGEGRRVSATTWESLKGAMYSVSPQTPITISSRAGPYER